MRSLAVKLLDGDEEIEAVFNPQRVRLAPSAGESEQASREDTAGREDVARPEDVSRDE